MSDESLVRNVIAVISSMTRGNDELSVLAFKIWKEKHNLSISECVSLAQKQLSDKSS